MSTLGWRVGSVPLGAWTEREGGREYFPLINVYYSTVDINAYSVGGHQCLRYYRS